MGSGAREHSLNSKFVRDSGYVPESVPNHPGPDEGFRWGCGWVGFLETAAWKSPLGRYHRHQRAHRSRPFLVQLGLEVDGVGPSAPPQHEAAGKSGFDDDDLRARPQHMLAEMSLMANSVSCTKRVEEVAKVKEKKGSASQK